MRYLSPLPRKYKAVAIGALIAWTVCIASALFGGRGLLHLQRLWRKQAEVEAVALALAEENQRLREHLRRLARDDAYLERLARERLGWIKGGEFVYRVPKQERAARTED